MGERCDRRLKKTYLGEMQLLQAKPYTFWPRTIRHAMGYVRYSFVRPRASRNWCEWKIVAGDEIEAGFFGRWEMGAQ